MFKRLYLKVDGERGKYRLKITPHSLRKYFRTQAAQGGLHVDIVEKLMGHSGYLSGAYLRLTDEEIRKAFHEHEGELFITRPDHRIQTGKLSMLEADNRELREQVSALQREQDLLQQIESDPRYKLAVAAAMAALKK